VVAVRLLVRNSLRGFPAFEPKGVSEKPPVTQRKMPVIRTVLLKDGNCVPTDIVTEIEGPFTTRPFLKLLKHLQVLILLREMTNWRPYQKSNQATITPTTSVSNIDSNQLSMLE